MEEPTEEELTEIDRLREEQLYWDLIKWGFWHLIHDDGDLLVLRMVHTSLIWAEVYKGDKPITFQHQEACPYECI